MPSKKCIIRMGIEVSEFTRHGNIVFESKEGRMSKLKYISWNVNGLRACIKKGFMDAFHDLDADCFCLQETKLQPDQIELDLPGYHQYWNSAVKKGYSGTAIFSKKEPLSVTYGLGIEEHDQEGRLITADFGSHYLLCCYTPNSQRGLVRLDYRMKWETEMIAYMKRLSEEKPVILCGDLNVAHEEIDIANPAFNHKNAGFTDEERSRMTELLSEGFTDSFRFKYPDKEKAYSWWSYFAKSRERNIGWRIDYFIVSNALKAHIEDAKIHPEIMGSDHCPVELDLDLD